MHPPPGTQVLSQLSPMVPSTHTAVKGNWFVGAVAKTPVLLPLLVLPPPPPAAGPLVGARVCGFDGGTVGEVGAAVGEVGAVVGEAVGTVVGSGGAMQMQR